MYIIDVIPLTKIPHAQPQILSYFASQALPQGALILAPLGKRKEMSVVLDSHRASDYKLEIKKAAFELKNIAKVISFEPVLTPPQIKLALWLGQYYFTSPGLFTKMMTPKKVQSSKFKVQNDNAKLKNDAQRHPERSKGSLANASQKLTIAPAISATEKIARENQSAAIWHSELTKKQQNEIWWKIKSSEIKTVIGTRSAVFLPFSNLKKVIIEDATNPNHRSWDMFPHYRAQEAAQKLTEIFGAKLIIKDYAPSIEFFGQAQALSEGRRDERSPAPNGAGRSEEQGWRGRPRAKSLRLPDAKIVDMRAELKNDNFSIFSRALQSAIAEALAQKKQIILFINRRGAANFVLCRDCGYVVKCQNCEAPLAYHLINGKPTLLCHRCGYQEKPPSLCPECQGYRIKTVGAGTQKVELEAKKLFPQARILRLDSDSAPAAKDQQKIIGVFVKKEADILVATQIIFSWQEELKQNPPAVIAVISADTLLHLPDYQSGERTFQTIAQLKNLHSSLLSSVEERTGARYCTNTAISTPPPAYAEAAAGKQSSPHLREKNLHFFIQTYNLENSVIKYAAAGDWRSFCKEELETRQALNYPPFSQIVKLTFRHRDPKKAGQEAKVLAIKLKNVIASVAALERGGAKQARRNSKNHEIAAALPTTSPRDDIQISDALPAFISKEKGRYVWNIIIKLTPRGVIPRSEATRDPAKNRKKYFLPFTTNEFLLRRNSLLQYVPLNWEIDVDPVDLL